MTDGTVLVTGGAGYIGGHTLGVRLEARPRGIHENGSTRHKLVEFVWRRDVRHLSRSCPAPTQPWRQLPRHHRDTRSDATEPPDDDTATRSRVTRVGAATRVNEHDQT